MKLYVNGDVHELDDTATVAELLEQLGAPGAGIAVEVNQALVRRADHAGHTLAEGDAVEIVGLVGGG